jgi:ATP-dependent Lhr-like helicase
VDYVGDLGNAAHVLKLLHQGEKRLVFCDSRARCEELAGLLRGQGVSVFVSHSSLSAEQRRDTEAAFRNASDCVIVATSTLELGIDVGDLDRVIQIDSPSTVSSFLQRLGRTGRRPGAKRNCLFLTTTHEALLQADAIVELWRQGFVEHLEPPLLPLHVVAQQLMALSLQQSGITRLGVTDWLGRTLRTMEVDRNCLAEIADHMLGEGILSEDTGLLGVGPTGERLYGMRNFMDLLSVFDTPPLLGVYWGPRDLGSVHPISLRRRNDEPVVLSLGGRSWRVTHVDYSRNTVHVVPAEEGGRSRWLGQSAPLSFALCQMIRRILLGEGDPLRWSKRAADAISEFRQQCPWVSPDGIVLLNDPGRSTASLWTFGGLSANAQLAVRAGADVIAIDNFSIRLANREAFLRATERDRGAHSATSGLAAANARRLKFTECLPQPLLARVESSRASGPVAARILAGLPTVIRVA